MFFDRFRKTPEQPPKREPWRDSTGKVACQGNCPNECDKQCPIWLNTIGLELLHMGQYDASIKAFQDAIRIAPDFLDVQNNLGTAYGTSNRHKEALEAFAKAHSMKPDYPKALFGLIVAETNLGMINEALAHCDEYDRLPGCDSTNLRKKIPARKETPKVTYMTMAAELLEAGRKAGGILSDGIPFIPELLALSDETCLKLITAIQEYGQTNPNADTTILSFMWSAFAGIGATYHWHTDWSTLSKDGLYETLTRERGVYEMDEYVLDITNLVDETIDAQSVWEHIRNMAHQCFQILVLKKIDPPAEMVFAAVKAMFVYGMVLEMNRLGMK